MPGEFIMHGSNVFTRLEKKMRVGKKRAIYMPKRFLNVLGLKEGDLVVVRVEGKRIVIEKAPDPLLLAVTREKWASTTVEEFEEESEVEQEDWN